MKTRVVVEEFEGTDILPDGRLMLYMTDSAGGTVRLKMEWDIARNMVESILDTLAMIDARCSRAYFALMGAEESVPPPQPSDN